MWNRIRRRSGPRFAEVAALAALVGLSGCYSFQAGSFPPPHIRTVAVLPFENDTDRFDLTEEIYTSLLRELPSALGLNNASEDVADAVVQGTIRGYDLSAPLYRQQPGGGRAEVLQREVTISLAVQIIDVRENVILWDNPSVTGRGQYPEAGGTEAQGRQEAIELIVQAIVDGAQSNW